VFNGSRFRSEVAPRISDFILSIETPAKKLAETQAQPARRPPLKVVG
jgi:poly(3-hydroxybutyrate) depolymerase